MNWNICISWLFKEQVDFPACLFHKQDKVILSRVDREWDKDFYISSAYQCGAYSYGYTHKKEWEGKSPWIKRFPLILTFFWNMDL